MFVTPGSRVRRPNTSTRLFSPTVAFGGASVGIVYGAQIGEYMQMGPAIFFQIYVIINNKGSSTGALTVTGIPFNFRGTVQFFNVGNSTGLTFAGILLGLSNSSSKLIQIFQNNAGALGTISNTNVTPLTDIGISGVCFAS